MWTSVTTTSRLYHWSVVRSPSRVRRIWYASWGVFLGTSFSSPAEWSPIKRLHESRAGGHLSGRPRVEGVTARRTPGAVDKRGLP